MIYLKPKLLLCHFCGIAIAEVIFPSGNGLCCKCFATLSPHLSPADYRSAAEAPTLRVLARLGSMDDLKRAVIGMMHDDGMNKTDIARQLKITRATVYSYLQKGRLCMSARGTISSTL